MNRNIKRIHRRDDLIDLVDLSEYLWKNGHLGHNLAIDYIDVDIEEDELYIHQIVLTNGKTLDESDITDWDEYNEFMVEIQEAIHVMNYDDSSGSDGSISERSFY